jgi:outer membrane protein assembly factor BamB
MHPLARVSSSRLASIVGLALVAVSAARGEEGIPAHSQRAARRILQTTGVRGGLVVHLGSGDGRLTAALRASDAYLVHGLDADAENVRAARAFVKSLGLYGPISMDRLTAPALPYADSLVNLLVAEELGDVPMSEIRRVLAPHGVALVKQDGAWNKTVQERPDAMDEWTHYLHGPDNNPVAHDRLVGPPRHLRWQGLPVFARAHEQLASLSACVTAAGRIFYIVDEAPPADVRLPSRWFLVARDAFSGVVLWKRPIDDWADQFRRFRSGPACLAFRLVVDRERLFVTLGFEAPVSLLDAVTGETIQTFEGTERAKQITHTGHALALLIDDEVAKHAEIDEAWRRGEYIDHHCHILKVDSATGKPLWRQDVDQLVFPCMAVDGGRLFAQSPSTLFCFDFDAGKPLWSVPLEMDLPVQAGKLSSGETQWPAPTVVARGDTVFVADFRTLSAFSAADGKLRWTGPSMNSFNAPPDLFLIHDLIWTNNKGTRTALDAASGVLRKEIQPEKAYMHPRCYRNKATDRYLMIGEVGVQFLDVDSGDTRRHHWVRGTCQYGILPANGLLYLTPHSCACNMKTKLAGLFALSADRTPTPPAAIGPRLEKGPAYRPTNADPSSPAASSDWPTYRHDPKRSGISTSPVPAQLAPAWTADLGGKLTSLTAAGGRVFVAQVDAHTVHALDERTGQTVWSYTAGGRVDSPPTIHGGLALFGSADGYLYAVRAADGQLAWRFRVAPEDRRAFVNGQLESVWPVHGSVLVENGRLVATAGRSSYLDGGIHVWRLDPAAGRAAGETVIYSPDPVTGKQPEDSDAKDVRGALSDILSSDGQNVYMRHLEIDFETGSDTGSGTHLFTPTGFLDDSWWHRAYWVVSDEFIAHWSGWWKTGNVVPSGRILSYDASNVYGFGRDQYHGGNTGQWQGGEKYQLFAFDRGAPQAERPKPPARGKAQKPSPLTYRWTTQVPLLVRAMVVAGDTLFIAGPPDVVKTAGTSGEAALQLVNPQETLDAWTGKLGATLLAVSTASGETVNEIKLDAPPVFDAMVVATGRIYMATMDGKVLCLAGR